VHAVNAIDDFRLGIDNLKTSLLTNRFVAKASPPSRKTF
jgi:hypothetical protein